jgi:hypothetical protein
MTKNSAGGDDNTTYIGKNCCAVVSEWGSILGFYIFRTFIIQN